MNKEQIENFKSEVSYKVTVEKTETFIKYDKSSYQNTHKKDENGDDIWENIPQPPCIENKSKTVFQQTSDKTDILALIAAVNGVTFQ